LKAQNRFILYHNFQHFAWKDFNSHDKTIYSPQFMAKILLETICNSLRKDPFVPSKNNNFSRVPVAHACNPSYSGSRDQEDHGSKPAQAKSSTRPYLEKKNPSQRRAGRVA
jgi:hypothetical protein